jgi:hypothetical protein
MSMGIWTAHEQPERPFDHKMWLCACDGCRHAPAAEAPVRPHTHLVLKNVADRLIVTLSCCCTPCGRRVGEGAVPCGG